MMLEKQKFIQSADKQSKYRETTNFETYKSLPQNNNIGEICATKKFNNHLNIHNISQKQFNSGRVTQRHNSLAAEEKEIKN